MRLFELFEESNKPDSNFTADDIKSLERISDVATLKARAKALVSTPSSKPMKPEKVKWLSHQIDSKSKAIDIIKLMYDLLLGGEGFSVIGSKHSTNPNSYRKTFS